MARLNPVPMGAVILGVAGLIPFLGFAALSVAGNDGGLGTLGLSPRTILSAYGAVIASFLGGIRWGAAAARNLATGIRWRQALRRGVCAGVHVDRRQRGLRAWRGWGVALGESATRLGCECRNKHGSCDEGHGVH